VVSDPLVRGDAISCSRVGGAMRSDAARLLHRQQTLERSLRELRGARGAQAQALRGSVGEQARLLGQVAGDLDRAGAALQRYATDLAQAMELARRAEASVRAAGLELDGTRVIEAWGPTSAETAERRRTLLPECQARVDRATSMAGRARAALQRVAVDLVPAFAGTASALRDAPGPPPPSS
jgi:hypothetical protein